MEPKVTVIIPIYNVEEYLSECLESVLLQSLHEIEVICIDDGSSDSSVEVIKKYADNDKRIVLYRQENQGPAAARNVGIKKAQGKYVMFMDGDDYYPDRDVLKSLFTVAEKNEVLVAGGEFSILLADGTITYAERFKDDPLQYGYHFEREGLVKYDEYQFDYGYHRFIYNRQFLINNSLFFPSLLRFQDPPFFVSTLVVAGEFYALKTATYIYRCGHKPVNWTKRKAQDLLEGIKQIYRIADEHSLSKLKELCIRRILYEYSDVIRRNISFLISKDVFGDDISIINSKVYEEYLLSNVVKYWNEPHDFLKNGVALIKNHNNKSTNKHIGIYYHHLSMGGVQKQIVRMARLFEKLGYIVTILLDDSNEYVIAEAKKYKIRSVVVAEDAYSYVNRAESIKTVCEEECIETVIYHSWLSYQLLWDMLILQSMDINVIIQAHSIFTAPLLEGNRYFYNYPDVYKYADAIVCLTDVDASYWRNFNENVYKVPNLLPDDPLRNGKDNNFEKTILWIGRLSEEKRPLDAIRIFAEIQKKVIDSNLFIVGDSKNEDIKNDCKRLAEELGVSKRVIFFGFIDDTSSVYKRARINLSTSAFEGYGLTYVETMSYGIPTVAYRMDYLDLQNDANGMSIVEQEDVAGAADKCIELLNNDELWEQKSSLALQGYEKLKQYDYEKAWKEVLMFHCTNTTQQAKECLQLLLEHGRKECSAISNELDYYKESFCRVSGSYSYKLGLFFTFIPRKIAHLFMGR